MTTNDFWKDRPTLVTGASGLLGSWLVPSLLSRGARVVCLLRDILPDSLLLSGGAVSDCACVYGDIRDGALLERILVEHEIDAVFHLAAQTIVAHAVTSPLGTFRSNIEGTWELLDACRRVGSISRIIVASSDKAYGTQPVLPYDEQMPLQGRAPYDVSKSCADLITASYAQTYGLPAAVTRCGNLYGGGDLNFSRLVPGTIRSALAGERPVLRSDGSAVRDYIYVEDAVAAYIGLAEKIDQPGVSGEGWNFSTERPLSSLEMTQAILAACGRADLEPQVLGTAQHEIDKQYLSAEKARTQLGWKPQYTVEEGLELAAEWYRSYLGY